MEFEKLSFIWLMVKKEIVGKMRYIDKFMGIHKFV